MDEPITLQLTPAQLQLLRDALDTHGGAAQDSLDQREDSTWLRGSDQELHATLQAVLQLQQLLELHGPE